MCWEHSSPVNVHVTARAATSEAVRCLAGKGAASQPGTAAGREVGVAAAAAEGQGQGGAGEEEQEVVSLECLKVRNPHATPVPSPRHTCPPMHTHLITHTPPPCRPCHPPVTHAPLMPPHATHPHHCRTRTRAHARRRQTRVMNGARAQSTTLRIRLQADVFRFYTRFLG